MFTIIFDKNTNRAIGTGQYTHQAILDENEVECTENQYNNFSDYILNGDKIVKSSKPIETVTNKILVPLSARQFWQAALVIGVTEEGLTSDVSNPESPLYVKDDAERESVLIDIKKTTQFARDHYLIEKLSTAKDIPTEQLDSLWQWASQIE